MEMERVLLNQNKHCLVRPMQHLLPVAAACTRMHACIRPQLPPLGMSPKPPLTLPLPRCTAPFTVLPGQARGAGQAVQRHAGRARRRCAPSPATLLAACCMRRVLITPACLPACRAIPPSPAHTKAPANTPKPRAQGVRRPARARGQRAGQRPGAHQGPRGAAQRQGASCFVCSDLVRSDMI